MELKNRLQAQKMLTTQAEEASKPLYVQVKELNSKVAMLQKTYQELSDALEFAEVERDKYREERDRLAVKLEEAERRAEELSRKLRDAEEQQAAELEKRKEEAASPDWKTFFSGLRSKFGTSSKQ